MAALEQRRSEIDPGIGAGNGSVVGRGVPGCKADDLKGFLQQLSDQIADADRRHSVVLRDMHERLSRLGGQTETLKAALPKEFSADLERLEDGVASLAQRIAESDHARQPEAAEPAVAPSSQAQVGPIEVRATSLEAPAAAPCQAAPAGHAFHSPARHHDDAESHIHADADPVAVPSWSDPSRAAFLTSPPALKSAVMPNTSTNWARPESPIRAVDLKADTDQPAALAAAAIKPAAPAMPQGGDEPWDNQAAEALTKLYDAVEDGLRSRQQSHEYLRPEPTVLSLVQPEVAPLAEAAPVLVKEQIEREWLDQRLNDIAARVEQSLADLRPENSLADLGRRFDQLEERWSTALSDVATRSDVEGLRLVEAHIAELTSRLEETQIQLARLDSIEAQLSELGHQLTDEQVVRLFGNLVPTEADLSHFAEQAAEKTAARMIAEMPAPVPHAAAAMPAVSAFASEHLELVQAAHADSTERLSALQDLLASFIDERRRGEAETAEALETMQHAMQHVLDRVDALDTTHQVLPEVHQAQLQGQGSDPHAMPAPQRHAGQAAAYAAVPESRDAFEEIRASAKAAAAAAAVGRMPAGSGNAAKARAQSEGDAGHRIEPVLDHNGPDVTTRGAGELAGLGDPRSSNGRGGQPAPNDRRSVVETARRAAEKAKVAAPAPEDAPKPKAAGIRDRLLGASNDAAKGGIRPVAIMVPALAMLLLAGFWFIASPKKAAVPVTATIEEINPAAPGAPIGQPGIAPTEKLEIPRSLAPSDNLELVPPQPAPLTNPEMKKPEQRSDVLPMRGRKTTETVNDPLLETGSIAATTAASGGGRVVAGPVPGMAIQQTGRAMTVEDALRAREKAQIASLSQQTALHAAANSAIPPAAVPAALQSGDVPSAQPETATGGQSVLELPPAHLGPLSLRLAAAKGDPSAQFEIAARLAEGKGVKQDFAQAALWYQRSAAQGLATAQYRLAALYERGLGVKADPARARVWYLRAAEQGSVKAMHNLAVLSASRDHGSTDYPTAVQWFGEAAERGLSDSQYNLGVLYESGLGVTKDPVAAYKWYAIAARTGDAEAVRRQQILRSKLDAITLQQAEESIQDWRPKSIDSKANDAMAAGLAWKSRANGTASAK